MCGLGCYLSKFVLRRTTASQSSVSAASLPLSRHSRYSPPACSVQHGPNGSGRKSERGPGALPHAARQGARRTRARGEALRLPRSRWASCHAQASASAALDLDASFFVLRSSMHRLAPHALWSLRTHVDLLCIGSTPSAAHHPPRRTDGHSHASAAKHCAAAAATTPIPPCTLAACAPSRLPCRSNQSGRSQLYPP